MNLLKGKCFGILKCLWGKCEISSIFFWYRVGNFHCKIIKLSVSYVLMYAWWDDGCGCACRWFRILPCCGSVPAPICAPDNIPPPPPTDNPTNIHTIHTHEANIPRFILLTPTARVFLLGGFFVKGNKKNDLSSCMYCNERARVYLQGGFHRKWCNQTSSESLRNFHLLERVGFLEN